MPRKDSTSLPFMRSASTVNYATNQHQQGVSMLSVPEVHEQPTPDISGIDFNILFQCNSE